MNSSKVPTPGTTTRLSGRWLTIARLGVMTLVGLTLVAFLPMLPAYISYLHTICSAVSCPAGQLTAATAGGLQRVGLSVNAYGAYTLALTLISLLMCLSVAAVLFLRKPDDWMALLVALMLALMATGFVTYVLLQRPSPWQVPALLLNTLAYAACFLVFSLFPTGRFVPAWIGWIPVAWIIWGLAMIFLHEIPLFFQLHYVVWLCALLGVLGAQIYRYRRASTLVQRQQTRWVIWGVSTGIVIAVAVALPYLLFPSLMQQNWLYQLLNAPADTLALFVASLSIGLAILRSHLWEIDRLINRTLVYGSLTGLLALVYVGLVIVLQTLVRVFTGAVSQSPVVIVISTLAIAALSQPLRHHMQRIIDRRFYRRKYDAAQTLAAFSETLRSEVDLNRLCEQLVEVVQETMEPAHISLWLRQPESLDAKKTRALPAIGDDWGEQ